MTAAAPPLAVEVGERSRRWIPWAVLIGGTLVLQLGFATAETFPALLDTTLEGPIDRAGAWMRSNRLTHPLFTGFFAPISSAVDGIISGVDAVLSWLPWYVLLGIVFAIPLRTRKWKEGAVAAGALAFTGIFDLWEPTIETLALMSTSVLLAVVLGVPLGTWAALRPKVEAVIRPVLDAMQTIPAFIYFLPLFMLFGIGNVPGAVATVIYALPPVVRLTTLGIRQVSPQAIEASRMFGSTIRQTLFKVQLPMAIPTILAGLSQTIMMALGIVVLATLVGSGGLGTPVLQSLNQRRTGRGIAAGLAIVAVAMVLDRIWRSLAEADPVFKRSRRFVVGVASALAIGTVVGRFAGWTDFPAVADWTAFDPIDGAVTWARDNLSWLTRPVNDFIVAVIYIPLRTFLTEVVAWPVLPFLTAWMCWRVKGPRLAVFSVVALAAVGAMGMWDLSIDTLVQVVIATVLAVAVAVPLGVWAGRRPRVEAAMGPILDALQTIPSLVYIIPAVILFTVGVVPGIIATVLYAMVPGIRITALGIRQVPSESIEASQTFGATPFQTLFGVRLPLAAPTIMAGVNQVIMMVLAMVIITGLVGGGALGFETVRALQRSLFGLGFEVGVALLAMAMILDRVTQAAGERLQPPTQ
jgi:glycine betaine/proline transport system permease protein